MAASKPRSVSERAADSVQRDGIAVASTSGEVEVGNRQRSRQQARGAITVIGAVMLSACASASGAPTRRQSGAVSSRPATLSPVTCSRGSAYGSTLAFELSIAPGVTGSPSPQQAAVSFVDHGGVPGFEGASKQWVRERDAQGVTLHDATTFLHVVQLPSGGWVVDSGGHCG